MSRPHKRRVILRLSWNITPGILARPKSRKQQLRFTILYIATAAASSTSINTSPQEQLSQENITRARLAANILWRDYNLSRLKKALLFASRTPVNAFVKIAFG
jgi:hypothetical protein